MKKSLLLFLIYTTIGFPAFYYAYKYGGPQFGEKDVFSYYKLYDNWDFAHVDAPFNQRILSTYSVFLLHKAGLHYTTEVAVSAVKLAPDIYFCALFFNFLCVVLTCVVLFRMMEFHLKAPPMVSFASGLVFLLGFGTIFFLISALTDALSVLLVAVIFDQYLRKSKWQFVFLLLAVFQREYIFFIFGLLAVLDLYWNRSEWKYYFTVLTANVLCFGMYFILRKTIFYTDRYNYQVAASHLIDNIRQNVQNVKQFVRQAFMMQNILFLYAGIIIYKWRKQLGFDRRKAITALFLLLQVVVIGFLVVLGNNTGRVFYMTMPLIIFYLAYEWMGISAIRKG